MITRKAAKAQSRRLERLGIDVSPQRLQEIHAGAQLRPGEFESVRPTKANAWIRRGVSPEQHAERAVQRDLIKTAVVAVVAAAGSATLLLVDLLC